MRARVQALLVATLLPAAGTALAQGAPPATAVPAQAAPATGQSSPRPEELEPGFSTSAPAPAPAPAPGPQAAAAPSPASRPSAGSAPQGTAPQGSTDKSAGATAAAARTHKGPVQAGGSGKAQDRIELDPTQITGNRELPKVLYIVPWKRSDLGDLVGKPVNSLVDEVLQPIDRDVFQRQNRYYRALQPDAAAGKAGGASGEGPH